MASTPPTWRQPKQQRLSGQGLRSTSEQIAAYLDDWALELHSDKDLREQPKNKEMTKKLFDIASRIDTDPWRGKLRTAIVENDFETMMKLASTSDVSKLDAKAVVLLGLALGYVGFIGEAPDEATDIVIAFLKKAQPYHPDDVWLQLALVGTSVIPVMKRPETVSEHLPKTIRYLTVANALRPGSSAILSFRAMMRAQLGEYDAAAADYQDAMNLVEGEERAAYAAAGFNVFWLAGKHALALDAAETALASNPKSYILNSQVADILMRAPEHLRDPKARAHLGPQGARALPRETRLLRLVRRSCPVRQSPVQGGTEDLRHDDLRRWSVAPRSRPTAMVLSGLAHVALGDKEKARPFHDKVSTRIGDKTVMSDIAPLWRKLREHFE